MAVEIVRRVAADDLRYILARPRTIELSTSKNFAFEHFVDFATQRDTTGSTLFEDGTPLAAGGVTRLSGNRGFVWLIASVDLRPYLITVMRELHAGTEAALAQGLDLYTTITPGHVDAEKLVRHMKFSPVAGQANVFTRKTST